MLFLIGKGGEGKSRVGIVLQSLLGSNMKTGSIAKVENNQFSRADLQHVLVMLDDDMKMEALSVFASWHSAMAHCKRSMTGATDSSAGS